ncbi:MAG TPA: hypothetical protein VGA77_17275 [Propylenella sp.]
MQPPADILRDHFLGWQCRIRQIAVRQDGGRPAPGMRPRVISTTGREIAAAFTVLVVPKEAAESTAFFRFQVQRTPDPREAYEGGLAYLQADYFQQPKRFSDRLTALLPEKSPVAAALLAEGGCLLEFNQYRQFYRLPCAVFELPAGDSAREATLWHNRVFNPSLTDDVQVLAFRPNWATTEARPSPQSHDSVRAQAKANRT